jgi:hypothetical protein
MTDKEQMMILTLKRGMILSILLVLAACSSGDNEGTGTNDNPGTESTVLKDQMKALDKAREVEQVLKESADKTRKAADQ